MKPPELKAVVIIPALNEGDSIGRVIADIPQPFRKQVIVADNGSSDDTAEVARQAGAEVVFVPKRGYGAACLSAIAFARDLDPDIYIFLDADYSDFPDDMERIVDHLRIQDLDLVIGSRTLGKAEAGAVLPQARFGNWLATRLIYLQWRHLYSDLGPFRAIRAKALYALQMRDTNFGWTVEMQIKALKKKMRVGEVSVRYRKRIGISKITGTLKGTLLAGTKILWTIARHGLFSSLADK